MITPRSTYYHYTYRPDGKKVKSTSAEKYIRVTVTVNADGDTIVRQHSRFNTDTRNYLGAFEISGSTWRVFHQAGHTDIASSGTVTNRFYLRDYLGSTAAVIDENGDVLQSTVYFPSGLPLTPNNLAPQTIRLHTGKDYFGLQDAGWYDNRARYYDCILARFTTQDPLAEKYPWLTPYNHCANNPLRYIDQNGMDIWTINDRGEITEHIVNKEIDKFIMANNDGSAKIDEEGNEVSISFKYGTIISQKSRKEIDKNRIVDIDIFKVRGDENGLNLFKFLSDNVSTPDVGIEYSLFQTGMQGENGLNFVSTSHLDAEDVSGKILFNKQLKYGYSIRRHIHSHPYGDTYSPSDARFSNSIKNILKNNNTISPSFFIYFVLAKQMIQYN